MAHKDEHDERQQSVREGFGDDGGTRVGRPDAPSRDDRSMERLAGSADPSGEGIEGSVLDAGGRSEQRADGSSTTGSSTGSLHGSSRHERTNDAEQRAQAAASGGEKTGAGGEANLGVEGARRSPAGSSVPLGTDPANQVDAHGADRAGSEPLAGRKTEHKGSYGGEMGAPRTSSDQREKPDYYGDKGTK